MANARIRPSFVLEDDASPLDQALASGRDRPLVLWGHPGIGQRSLLAAAAAAGGRTLRRLQPSDLTSWGALRDVSASGHFRAISLEQFLDTGERGDPQTFAPAPDELLHIHGLNEVATALVGTVFDGILDEGRLLNNLLPDGVGIVATAWPQDRQQAVDLLGPVLGEVWGSIKGRAELKYPVHPLPKRLLAAAEHWSIVPSVLRFVTLGRRQGLAEEVLGYLEDAHKSDPTLALVNLHASLLHRADPFPQIASPASFAELGTLLAERRLLFSSRAIRLALHRAPGADDFLGWFHEHMQGWDPERWIRADDVQTLRGEPVPGSVWLRHLRDSVRRGESRITLSELATYASFERASLTLWATQELGDELGANFVEAMVLSAADLRRLGG